VGPEWADLVRDLDHRHETTITVGEQRDVVRSEITGTLRSRGLACAI
jgi:hypothetical protein